MTRYTSNDGFAINDTYGDMYMCDKTNGAINLQRNDYPFAYRFAEGIVGNFLNIKLTQEFIYVLSDKNPYLYRFKYNGIRSDITVPDRYLKHFKLHSGMAVDEAGNLLLYNSHLNNHISILNSEGQTLHIFEALVAKPFAIAINSNGRIVIVDSCYCTQMYYIFICFIRLLYLSCTLFNKLL